MTFQRRESGSDGDAAGENGDNHHHQGHQPGQRDGLLLVLAEVHAGQAHQQEGRGGQRGDGEADGHLTQDSGAADIYTGDAEALGGLSQHGEYAVVEGVGIKEVSL